MITIHAGHAPDGGKGCGAVGYIKESTEARSLVDMITKKLEIMSNAFSNITVEENMNKTDVLDTLVTRANREKDADLHLSIHFNAGANGVHDGKTTGTEAYIYPGSTSRQIAETLVAKTAETLGVVNRGVKERADFYFLRKTKAPAIILEVCFVDDPEDVDAYKAKKEELAIVLALEIETRKKVEYSSYHGELSVKVDPVNEEKCKVVFPDGAAEVTVTKNWAAKNVRKS